MNPQIQLLPPKKLVGLQSRMCLADNKTTLLWQTFMPRRNQIANRVNADFISMQVYDKEVDMATFNGHTPFQKWAAVEVDSFDHVPDGMETYIMPGGLYAMFVYKGQPATFHLALQKFYGEWLPQSGYSLDAREHFEVLGSKYKRDSDDSEEEVWIPVKKEA